MDNRLPAAAPLALVILITGALFASAGEVDHRFEGIWTGVETLQIPATPGQQGYPPIQKPVIIAVGDSGRIMAVAQGFGFGRYEVLGQSNGETLSFRSFGSGFTDRLRFKIPVGSQFDCPARRFSGTLTLSPDGNTLTEKGQAFVERLSCNITATLHRQGKR